MDDAVGALVDSEDDVLELLRSPTGPDLPGFPELRSLAGSPVCEARSKVGRIDLDFAIEQAEGPLLESPSGQRELEVEAVDPVVGDL